MPLKHPFHIYRELRFYNEKIWWRIVAVKATPWDCCVMPNDAWPPLGVFGVIPDPHDVHNACEFGVLLWKMTECILHSIMWPLEIIYN